MLFWKKKVENYADISHINRQKDWKTNILMIFVRYNKQFYKGDKKIHWNVLTTFSLSDIIYSQRAYSRRKKWIYFIHFLQKQMKFCCGREKKRAVFPQEPVAAEKLLCDASECASLAGKLTEAFLCRQNGIILSALLLPALQKHRWFRRIPKKKEEGRNE